MTIAFPVLASAWTAGIGALRGLGEMIGKGVEGKGLAGRQSEEPKTPTPSPLPEAVKTALRELEASLTPRLNELGAEVAPGFLQVTGPGKLRAAEGHPAEALIEHVLSGDPQTVSRVREIEAMLGTRGSRFDWSA